MSKILVLNFFPAFTPPASGGELRYFHLYENLSKYFDITLLSPTYNEHKLELVEHSSSFREYRVPKEDIHNEIHWKLEQEKFSSEFSALTMAYSGEHFNEYHKMYLKLYESSDIIIHDFPYMLNYDLYFGMDNKPRIYNSHNLEYDLLKQIYKGENSGKHLEYIYQLEKKLIEKADIVFATSNIEKNKFVELYGCEYDKMCLAPNGINENTFLRRSTEIDRKTAFFIGSGHPPNIESVNFIINSVAENCKDVTFIIAGACCNGIISDKPNVKLLGKITDEEKDRLFNSVDISINPMFTGAGTNLKTLEYLSMGIPMISTDTGVRGIELIDNEHFILAHKNNFSVKINSLLNNENLKSRISEKAREYINRNFNWGVIAKNIYENIIQIKKNKPKTIFILNDFEVSNPFGGGEIRINRLYSELSKYYNISLLCLNNKNKVKKTWIKKNFVELSVPKTKSHLQEEENINSQYWVSANDIVSSYMIEENEIFMTILKEMSLKQDILILNHPYLAKALNDINAKFLIHESLNAEYELKKEILNGHPSYIKLIEQVKEVESLACNRSNLLISVSDDDHNGLNSYLLKKGDIYTIKNGVDVIKSDIYNSSYYPEVRKLFGESKIGLFIGSGHMPNIDSVKFIINELAVKLNNIYFVIIGSVCNAFLQENVPSNVLLFGQLDLEYKDVLCRISDFALNPMFGGSGSNLKLADYFSWKLPTITTICGARGYDIKNNHHALICDIEEFDEKIKLLVENPELSKKLSKNAYKYVLKNLNWSVLAREYRNILDREVYKKIRKKLLIVTYRFTIPPLGGAEVYMYELIKNLDKSDDLDITLVSLDSYDISNKYHFSIEATRHENSDKYNVFDNVLIESLKFDELNDFEKFENSKILMKNWMDEFLISARKFIDKYTSHIILGGWNFPEKVENGYQLWSSGLSEIFIFNSTNLKIFGFTPSKKILKISQDGELIFEDFIDSNFEIELNITKQCILTFESDTEYIDNEIRPLSFLITKFLFNQEDYSLGNGYRDFLKHNYISEYIDELILNAKNRDNELDAIFQKTRGLNSLELENYLESNIQKFDVILGHSIPFATTPIVSKYAKKYNKPYCLLPHFHFDDEFYHWNSYYKAMEDANIVFAFPTVSKSLFYDKLHINTIGIPGGGIKKDEYDNVNLDNFKNLYNSEKSFFLVLGRKAGAKNYRSVIESIDLVNKEKHICNLVMIGRDEDNAKIDSQFTYYMGEQPRDVVLGALKDCIGLITMSESESFGIVIIEAWMFEKSVIINENCPAFVELVNDGFNGLYANKENLDKKILEILENGIDLGINGSLRTSEFEWKNISKLFSDTVKQISF